MNRPSPAMEGVCLTFNRLEGVPSGWNERRYGIAGNRRPP